MFLNQLSIGKRLTLVLGVILALFLLSSIVAVVRLGQLGTEIDTMVNDNIQVERAGADWLRHTTSGVQRAAAIAKSSDASLIAYFAPATAASISQTNELQKFIESKMDTRAEKELFTKVGELRKAYLAAREEVSKFKQAGDAENAGKVFTERFEPTSRDYLAGVQQLVDAQRSDLDAAGKRAEELRSQTTMLLYVCTAVSLVLGALLAWLLAASITRPLRKAEAIAESIANMDLTGSPQASYANDETGHLLRSLDAMRSALHGSLQQVRGVVDSISTASAQIAVGNREGIDVAIRVRPPPLEDSDLVMRVLAERGQCLVACPRLLAEGIPLVPADLAGLPSMDLGLPQHEHVWNLIGPDGAQAAIRHRPRLITRGMLALRAAAIAGVGIVQLPSMMVSEQIESGELVQVIPGWAPRREIIHAVFASRRGLLPAVRALVDFLAVQFEGLDED